MGADEYLERLEGKIRKCLFFYVKIFKNNSERLKRSSTYFQFVSKAHKQRVKKHEKLIHESNFRKPVES